MTDLYVYAPTHESARAWVERQRPGVHRPPFVFVDTPAALSRVPEGETLYLLSRFALSGNMRRALAARSDLKVVNP